MREKREVEDIFRARAVPERQLTMTPGKNQEGFEVKLIVIIFKLNPT